jgi:Leucine-rich repeat (LRR) protein
LEFLPDDICELRNLIKLDISKNLIRKLPLGIGRIKTLRIFDLEGNKFDDPGIQSSLEKSLSSLMEFLAQTEKVK